MGEPPKLGNAGAMPPWDERRGWSPKNKPIPVCYHAKFSRSTSKGVDINGSRTPKLGFYCACNHGIRNAQRYNTTMDNKCDSLLCVSFLRRGRKYKQSRPKNTHRFLVCRKTHIALVNAN